jgi:hypothetical protein
MNAPSLAWALAAQAIGYKLETVPLPAGTHEAEVGRWRLVANNSKFELVHSRAGKRDVTLPPFEVYVEHLDYLVFGLLGPEGGLLGGGYSEDEFIADMVDYLPPDAVALFADGLEARKETKQ